MSDQDVAAGNHPSLLRRPGCWIAFLTVIPLLIGITCVLYNWAAARQLARTKAELAAASIELDPSKIPSDRPPDESNFCATPLIQSLTDGTASGPQMEAITRVAKWRSLAGKAGARLQSARHPAPTDWRAVRDAVAAGDRHAALDPQAPPTAALSQSLEADLGPVFAELWSAVDRPHSMIVPTCLDELKAGRRTYSGSPWAINTRALAETLYLRASLDCDGSMQARGLESARVLLRLADGADHRGGKAAGMVGASLRSLVHNLAWSCAARRLLTRDEWMKLAQLFANDHPQDRLRPALHLEIIYSQWTMAEIKAAPQRVFTHMPASSPAPGLSPALQAAATFIPQGWFDMNEATALKTYGELWSRLQDTSAPDLYPDLYAIITQRLAAPGNGHELLQHGRLALPLTVYIPIWVRGFLSSHAVSRLAEAACALEAHFADHQSYPESLDALVPVYLPAVPADLDGQPIRYAQDPANGRYRLWSIGSNGIDDGGLIKSTTPHSIGNPWNEPHGDWVWHYPP